MNARYWDSYAVSGLPKFPNQAKLCQRLATLKPDFHIESDKWNPLTVLLLVANESLSTLRNYTEEKTSSLHNHEKTVSRLLGLENPRITRKTTYQYFSTSGSGIAAPQVTLGFQKPLGYSFQLPSGFRETPQEFETDVPDDITYYPIKAHMAIYSFFNNFASALDRLAHELVPLYAINLAPTKIDWNALAKTDKSSKSILSERDSGLAMIYSNYQTYFDKSFRYRNILAHHGYLQIRVDLALLTGKWGVFLPDNPDDKNSPSNVEAIAYTSSELARLVTFLDSVYAHILGKLSASLPPW